MTQGFQYAISLSVIGDSHIMQLVSRLDELERRFNGVQSEVSETAERLNRLGSSGSGIDSLKGKFTSLIATIGGTAAVVNSLQTAASFEGMQRGIAFTSGSAEVAKKNFEFLDSTIAKLSINKQAAYEGFKSLQGGMMGTGITADQTRGIFESVSKASVVMGLDAEQQKGSFLALSQMASKGTVSAEELRGQLGERLPGAFNIAARAMKVGTSELGDMLKKGQVMANDFLPKFSAELEKTFGAGVEAATMGASANFGKFSNSIFDLKIAVGEHLMPIAISFLNNYLIPSVAWIGQHISLISDLAGAGLAMYGTWKVLQTGASLYSATMGIVAIANGSTTATVLGLNAAFLLSPITWVAAAAIALGGAVYYAYNHFEGFRATVSGVWNVMKWFGNSLWTNLQKVYAFAQGIYDVLKPAFEFIGGIIYNVFVKPLMVAFDLLGKLTSWVGEKTGITAKFNEGYNGGLDATNKGVLGSVFADSKGGTGSGGSTGGTGNDPIKKGTEAISNGGQRNITINIGKLNEKIEIHAGSRGFSESSDEMMDMMIKKLLQVINSANQMQGAH